MKIKIVIVGKIKKPYLRDGTRDYIKRLSPYAKVELVEVRSEPDQPRESEVQNALKREAHRIFRALAPSEYPVALDIKGEEMSSGALAKWLKNMMVQGQSNIAFIIGGSFGLHAEVLNKAKKRVSLGPLTFPHQVVPFILLEQLYRAFKMIAGEPYHK